MANFKKGDKVRVLTLHGLQLNKDMLKVGDILDIDEDNSVMPFCVWPDGERRPLKQNRLELFLEAGEQVVPEQSVAMFEFDPDMTGTTSVGGCTCEKRKMVNFGCQCEAGLAELAAERGK